MSCAGGPVGKAFHVSVMEAGSSGVDCEVCAGKGLVPLLCERKILSGMWMSLSLLLALQAHCLAYQYTS